MKQHGAEQLHAGIAQLGLAIEADAEQRLLDYLQLLSKWNRVYNLTAVREEAAMVSQHLFDCLSVLPHLAKQASQIETLADVGSGAGLPGIPLAIARPDLRVTLIESNHKKTSFLQQVKIEIKLDNVSVHHGRVEGYQPVHRFDAVITRAFSSLGEFVLRSAHLLDEGGRLYAMKGVYPQQEIAELPPAWQLVQSISLRVPGLDAQRHLIVLQ